jgi:hypothetical protein
VTGTVSGMSLWDPPAGCVSDTARPTSDTMVLLYLPKTARVLTLTTQDAHTDFDTVMYLVKGCPDDSRLSLACNDDQPGPSSSLTFTNLSAGEYRVIIDSLTRRGGSFALSSTAR